MHFIVQLRILRTKEYIRVRLGEAPGREPFLLGACARAPGYSRTGYYGVGIYEGVERVYPFVRYGVGVHED